MNKLSREELLIISNMPSLGLNYHTRGSSAEDEKIRLVLAEYDIDLRDVAILGKHVHALVTSISHDYGAIAEQLFAYEATHRAGAKSWMRIWHLDSVDGDEELSGLVNDLLSKWNGREYVEPHEIMHVLCVMGFLARNSIMDFSSDSLLEDLNRYLVETRLEYVDQEYRLDQRSAYGLGYMLSADDEVKIAAENAINGAILRQLTSEKGGAAATLPHLLSTNTDAAMQLLEREYHENGDELVYAFDDALDMRAVVASLLEVKGRNRIKVLTKFLHRYETIRTPLVLEKAIRVMEQMTQEMEVIKEGLDREQKPLQVIRVTELQEMIEQQAAKVMTQLERIQLRSGS